MHHKPSEEEYFKLNCFDGYEIEFREGSLDEKYDFIYSIAVIHMFVIEDHRNKFYKFIYGYKKFYYTDDIK